MPQTKFTSLAEMKQAMEQIESLCESKNTSLAGMGALQPIVAAIVLLTTEIETLKRGAIVGP